MVINPSYNISNSYSEGIRINKDTNNWSVIALGGDVGSTSGTNAKTWLIGDYDGTFYLSLNGSDSAATRFRGSGNGFIAYPRLGVNGENTGYNFYVNGTSLFNGAVNMSGVLIVETNNTWLSPSRVQIGRTGTTVYSDRSTIGTTDGNLHLDSYKGHGVYINFYSGKDKSDGTQGTMFSPNGNVNIGTASDKGYKLYVNGNGYFTGNVNIVTNSQPQLNITGTAGNWTYIRLHNGNNLWDIASHRDNISGSLQLRAGGGDTNRAVFNTNGRLDIYSTQGQNNTIKINSNNAESTICYSGGDYTTWTVGRSPGVQDSRFGWWNGSRNVMWLENTGILHIGTAKNYNELRIHGAFDASGTGIQDGNDRPSLKITGNYPQLVLMGGGIGNAGHGATFAIGAWDGANATSGDFRTWTFGTPGYNATWMDLAYNVNGTNPHNGINDWTQSGATHHRLIRFRGDTQQLLLYGIGNDSQPTLQINSSRNGSLVYTAGFLAPNLTANNNNFIVLGKAMSTRNSFGFTHMHIADGSTSNYGAVEIFGVGNAQRWYYDRHSAFMARLDVANQANDANYMYSALQIREYNYGGVQADTWAIAPRLSWHWSGRVQTQIGLSSNGELYLSKDQFANRYKLLYENGGTWGINISGNATAAHRLIDQGVITAISGTSRYTSGLRIGGVYNSGYPFSYGVTLTMEASNFGAELIFNGLGGGGATGSGDMRFRTHSDWSTSEWGSWRTVLDSSNYINYSYLNNVSGHGVSISQSSFTNNPWGAGNLTLVWGQRGINSSLSGDSADITLCYGTHGAAGGAGWFMSIDGGIYSLAGIYSAVWNDYAEFRQASTKEPGRVVYELGDDSLAETTQRLQHFAGVISDTYGFSEGKTKKANTPLAVAGRVLVYPYQDRNNYKPGDCVCTAPEGTVDIMTRDEIAMYPDRIVGTVSCIPTYEKWGTGNVKVNGRIWIKVR